jgi:uncharacterized membrane protein YbhN (UPF0104 family)
LTARVAGAPFFVRFKSTAILLVKIALAAVLVWWLWRSGRLDFSQFRTVKIGGAFFGLLFLQAAMLGCIALRWHFLTRACGLDFSLRQTLRISLFGSFAAVWTPAGLGLDGARLWQARRLAPGQMPKIIASTFWDRALGVWSVLVLTAISCAILLEVSQLEMSAELRHALWGVLVFCAGLAALPLVAHRPLARLLQRRWPATAVSFGGLRGTAWRSALLFAFLTHGCNAFSVWCALQVLGAQGSAPLLAVLLVAPLIILSSLVPLTPLGLGVTDAAASTLLHVIGNNSGAEATMLGRATFVLLSALCGLVWLCTGWGEH